MSCAATSGSRSDGSGASRRTAVVLAAAFVAAGCLATVRLARDGSGFDHAGHGKRDLACVDCHSDAKSKPSAGMPPGAQCADCHDPKAEKPATLAAIRDYETARIAKKFPDASVRGATYADVSFSHKRHADAKVDCAKCHPGATTGRLANPDGPLSMDACEQCHAERGLKLDCAACHEKRAKDEKPPNHGPAWPLHHGYVSRAPDRALAGERCDLCHTQASCDACHTRNAPRDHTQSWRVATHGLSASMDRTRCVACHQADSCDRCHATQPPRSHRAGFGAPRDNHCLSCHLPAASEGCVACHKGTPSHERAKPKPLWHQASMNCTQCHGAGEALPHVVGSTDCNACHQ